MKLLKKIPLIWWLYIVLGLLSLAFIIVYWIEPISISIRNVLMSIGASLIGAVVLGIFIELIINKKNRRLKDDIFEDSIISAKETIRELDCVFQEFRNDEDIDFEFTDDKDFINKSVKIYLELRDKRDTASDELADRINQAITNDIFTSFIIDSCKNTIAVFDIVLRSQNELITKGFITKEEITIMSRARIKMQRLVNESEERSYSMLLSNRLDFREELQNVINIKQ